jgi:ABC-2 type transport system ATP-binding protein
MYVAIEAEQLAKRYDGGPEVLRDVTFAVEEGEIFGLVGGDGAGKTTTVRILAGLTPPTAGRARVAGLDVVERTRDVRARIGVTLPEPRVGGPDVLLLDEPTAGLDPRRRRAVWDDIRRLRGEGTTVRFTTRHLEEAQALADRLAVLQGGRLVAVGPPLATLERVALVS